jgi:hypothetical protein
MTTDTHTYPTTDEITALCRGGTFPWDQMPLVRVEAVTSPVHAMQIARHITPGHHWLNLREVPFAINQQLIAPLREYSDDKFLDSELSWYYIAKIPLSGQLCWKGNPNRRLVFGQRPSVGVLIVAEVGCDHDMSQVRKGNCYAEYACSKCGFHWGVDSSD